MSQKCIFSNNSCLKPLFFFRFFLENASFCARFLVSLIGQTCCTLVFHNLNRTKKTRKPLFFCRNLGFVAKQQKPVLTSGSKCSKSRDLIAIASVFRRPCWVFFLIALVHLSCFFVTLGSTYLSSCLDALGGSGLAVF